VAPERQSDVGFGTILEFNPSWQIAEVRPNLPQTGTEQFGLDPKPAADHHQLGLLPLKSCRVETLASRVF
jgi:hypothetical protein